MAAVWAPTGFSLRRVMTQARGSWPGTTRTAEAVGDLPGRCPAKDPLKLSLAVMEWPHQDLHDAYSVVPASVIPAATGVPATSRSPGPGRRPGGGQIGSLT